ncbi:aromatic-ring-hydroxylating dioxygenase subunit beta [Acetobacter oryzifermentans]|uniref:aromatic-ring-hydroxylating dioxygenase subunit beta n=1 Tax=Acetobacter TaxID=434 RepID=UPI0039BFBC23
MSISLNDAVELVTLEADLLDDGQFVEWLKLYTQSGLYIIPIDPAADDYADTLNYAYDDAEMRQKRVERLIGGRAISAAPPAQTIRLLSRYRILESDDQKCVLRCAQLLTELRQGRERSYVANVIFTLVKEGDSLKIDQKVIKLLGSTEALTAVSYIL